MISPRIGIATIIKKNNKILLGKRKSELGKGTWGLPGGKLEFGEDPKECAIRELKEETNLNTTIDDVLFVGVSNTIFDKKTHYITLIYKVISFTGEIKIMEPDKCEYWTWFDINELPKQLFKPLQNYLNEYKYIVKNNISSG